MHVGAKFARMNDGSRKQKMHSQEQPRFRGVAPRSADDSEIHKKNEVSLRSFTFFRCSQLFIQDL